MYHIAEALYCFYQMARSPLSRYFRHFCTLQSWTDKPIRFATGAICHIESVLDRDKAYSLFSLHIFIIFHNVSSYSIMTLIVRTITAFYTPLDHFLHLLLHLLYIYSFFSLYTNIHIAIFYHLLSLYYQIFKNLIHFIITMIRRMNIYNFLIATTAI